MLNPSCMYRYVDIDILSNASIPGWSTLTSDLLYKAIHHQNTVFPSCRQDISRSIGPISLHALWSCIQVDSDSLSNASIFGWCTQCTLTFDLLFNVIHCEILFFGLEAGYLKHCPMFISSCIYRWILTASRTHQLLAGLPWPLIYFSCSFFR